MTAAIAPVELPPLTPDQLHQAIAAARRPGWPASNDVVLADPIYSRLVRAQATRLLRGEDVHPPHPQPYDRCIPQPPQPLEDPPPFVPATPHPPRPMPVPRRAPLPEPRAVDVVDRKRAAAGDND